MNNRPGRSIAGCAFIMASLCHTQPIRAESIRVPQWPLRNGDFSMVGGRAGAVPMAQMYWQQYSASGERSFSVEPPAGEIANFDADNPPAAAVITTTKAGNGNWRQTFPLEKGEYRLSADVWGTAGGKAYISIAETSRPHRLIDVTEAKQTITCPVTAPGGEVTVSLGSLAPGTVKFANVKIEATKLASSVIPTENPVAIGGIVLPPRPTPAEQWACYQLQHFTNRITGRIPGLKGRDPVFPRRLVYIGRAAREELKRLKGLPVDSYLVGSTGKAIVLAGNSDEATLYAVFDFLKQQGCRWITPGAAGEVIPKKTKLVYAPLRKEVPQFDVRGGLVSYSNFSSIGEQTFVNVDDHFDWAVRNRQNVVWLAYGKTSDMGAHRGHGWIQAMNHSYNLTIAPGEKYFQDHPDWYPLVKGVRMAKDKNGAHTQLCVSSQGLRDYTVKLALEYFKNNPNSKVFAMNPNDGVSFWCECDKCKALDGSTINWSRNGIDQLAMTDRALSYANYVAEKIAKIYPGHLVEMYAYGCTREPPLNTRVQKNVLIHYAYWGGPLNKPFMYEAEPNRFQEYRLHLDGWKKMGARKLIHYNYLDWYHQDAPIFWSNNIVEVMKGLKQQYNFMGRLGETETPIEASPVFYAVMTQADWNPNFDYKTVIKDVCEKFYGKAAATMFKYNMLMDDAVMMSTAWKEKDWIPQNQFEFSMALLDDGNKLLEEADMQAAEDAVVRQRIAQARFSHAYLTYIRALGEPRMNLDTYTKGYEAFLRANDIRRVLGVRVLWPTFRDLQSFKIAPMLGAGSHVQDLPIEWKFKTDPADDGQKDEWFKTQPDGSWRSISTDKAWTAQGIDHHGVAWYSVQFKLSAEDVKSKLALYFAAVDGYCDIYLDGVKIGEQKVDVSQMWDQPFRVNLLQNIAPNVSHTLMVRVLKENFAAGIWKPVTLIKAEEP